MNLQAIQYQTELKYSKQHIRRVILNELMKVKSKSFHKQLKKLSKIVDDTFLVEFLIVILIHEFSSIQYICSKLGQYVKMDKNLDVFDRVHKTFTLLYNIASDTDFIELIESENGLYIKSNFSCKKSVLQYIADTMNLPPMICEPNKLTRNDGSAYLTTEDHVILKPKNQHNHYQNLDAINVSNQIALSIDERMILLKEQPTKKLKGKVNKKNFKVFRKSSEKVYEYLIQHGNKFYIPHKYDHRGRIYEDTYHVGIMKNTYRKGMIQLHQKYLIPLD